MELASLLQCSKDVFAEMLRKMDRDLLFVLRTTYLLQSISIELGCESEVNRFNIMARHSIQGTHKSVEPSQGYFSSIRHKFSLWKEQLMFEINLLIAQTFFAIFQSKIPVNNTTDPSNNIPQKE